MSARRRTKPMNVRNQKAFKAGMVVNDLGVCAAQGKRMFKSRKQVHDANQSNPNRIRAYRCPHCGKWHGARKKDET